MAPLVVLLSLLGTVAAQACQVHSDTFEEDFCHMKATVDVLKGDTQRVSNNEVELSKLWHTIHTETKSIYDNRQMIEDLQSNLTKQNFAPSSSSDVMEAIHNITSNVDDKMKNLTDTVTALESRMRQLEIKCSSCGTGGHPCSLRPCENGGKCVELGKDFHCVCPVGFAGKLCDVTDHCTPSPCLNNGTCVNNVVSHTCVCTLPFTGPNCTIELTACDMNPCARGMCVPDGRNYKCLCDPGFYGEYCNSRIDPKLITTASSPSPSISTPKAIKNTTISKMSTSSSFTTLPTDSTANSSRSTATVTASAHSSLSTKITVQTTGFSTTSANPTDNSSTSTQPTGSTITTMTDPCAKPGICNEPSICVVRGVSYECVCPPTNETMNDPCLEPVLVQPFNICCVQDTCQPITQPKC
ncbi:fibropellin-1-like [Ostrea edulis]|uniref:fibropellin-1-like n=1 Tax=Ostrea edulis TaxID=37623 RepID=UPI0024AEB5A0|nr:fibropellin-1-like [Ostrea edulis]